jgi:hypothetical protein
MPYTPVITFSDGNPLPAADLNSNFSNLDYLNAKINTQIQIRASAMTPRQSSGASPGSFVTGSNLRNYDTMDFPDVSQTFADFFLVLPSDYDGGTITAKFLWTANSTSTNAVVLGIAAVAITDDETLDAGTGTSQQVTDANKSTAYDLNITADTPALTIAGTPAANKLAFFTIFRNPGDASDTLAATVRLLGVVITYTRA